jgi:hypothetical protein
MRAMMFLLSSYLVHCSLPSESLGRLYPVYKERKDQEKEIRNMACRCDWGEGVLESLRRQQRSIELLPIYSLDVYNHRCVNTGAKCHPVCRTINYLRAPPPLSGDVFTLIWTNFGAWARFIGAGIWQLIFSSSWQRKKGGCGN